MLAAGWRSSDRESAARGLRSNRCRGAAAARSDRRRAPSNAACRCTPIPCDPATGRLRRASRPAPILIWIWSADARYCAVTPKRPGRHLLDLRAQRIAVFQRDIDDHLIADHRLHRVAVLDRNAAQFVAIAVFVLAAFARVRLAADAVHRNRERRVRFGGDRAERHRAGRKALDDFLSRLHFVERNRLRRVDLEYRTGRGTVM